MRILFWAPGFYQVGDHFRCLQFAKGLSARGHDVTCLLGSRQLSFRFRFRREGDVMIVHPPYFGELPLAERLWTSQPETKLPLDTLTRCLWVIARRRRYDVIHSFHIGANSLLPYLVARATSHGAVCVQDWCDLWTGGILSPPCNSLLRRFDHWLSTTAESLHIKCATALTVNNSYLADKAVTEFGLTRDRVLLAVEGADTDIVVPEDKIACRAALKLPSSTIWLGFSAFFNPDTTLLLGAMRLLSSLDSPVRIRLLWIGPIDDRIERAIAAANLQGAIHCVGPVARERLTLYLGACDLLALPFSARPVNLGRWPAKLGDYLAAGRPVVTNATGDVGRFFQLHEGIGVATVDHPEAFAAAIRHLADRPDLRETYGTTARCVAESALSVSRVVRSLETFYSAL